MPEYDKETSKRLHNDYHVMKITIRPAEGQLLVPSEAFHKRIREELSEYMLEIQRPYHSIWTREFFDPRSPVYNYEQQTQPNALATGNSLSLQNGRYLAAVTLPAAIIEAIPNPRGRPGLRQSEVEGGRQPYKLAGVRDPIEFGIARAVAVQTYRLVRVIAGYFDAGKREVAIDEAMTLLHPYVAPILPLTFHAESSSQGIDDTHPVVSKLIRDLCEEAPLHVADLYGTVDRREMGWKWTEEGKALAAERRIDPLELPHIAGMLNVLNGLIQLRLEARYTANAKLRMKGEAVKQNRAASADRTVGYRVSPEITDAVGLTRHPARLPNEAMLVRMAYDMEFDPSRLVPNKSYLQPLLEAASALGAYQRRGATDRSLLATYGLRAWSQNFYGYDHPACLSALEIVPIVPSAMQPATDDLPRAAPLNDEMQQAKSIR